METERINIRGINFDDVDKKQALERCIGMLSSDGCSVIHTPNSEIVQLCIDDEKYYSVINSADLIIPDGAGVILASKILKKPLKKGKVAGVELFEEIVSYCAQNGKKVFLLGGRPGIAEKAEENFKKKYPSLEICGTNDGYFTKEGEENEKIIAKINESSPDFLAVCLGVPAQEVWMKNNRDRLNVHLMGGFGGSLDVFAGVAKRAPKIFIDLKLEWFYRLCKEPKRIGRMMNIPKFIFGCIIDKGADRK